MAAAADTDAEAGIAGADDGALDVRGDDKRGLFHGGVEESEVLDVGFEVSVVGGGVGGVEEIGCREGGVGEMPKAIGEVLLGCLC